MAFPIYLQADCADFDGPLDLRRSAVPEFWAGSDVEFRIALFEFGVIRSVADIASLTVEIKAKGAGDTAPQPGAAALMTKTVTSLDGDTTEAEWYAYTHAHAVVRFTSEESAIVAGTHWLVVTALTNDTIPQTLTLCAGEIVVAEDGHGTVGELPIENGTGYTKAESDARYARIGSIASDGDSGDLSAYESRIAALETAAASDASRLASAESGIDALASSLATRASSAEVTAALALKASATDLSGAISTEVSNRNAAIASAVASEVTSRNAAIASAISSAQRAGRTITGTSDSFALADAGTSISCTSASAVCFCAFLKLL
ncbi:MAG TPA: hypothetical protein PKI32_04205 [Opitutales bacterium]|nr:hypothetical protein [Opitutales bacterium]